DRFGNPGKNQSLFNFKKKFQPTWESRYLVYSDALSLPKIGWALYYVHQRNTTLLGMVRRSLQEWQENRRELQKKATSVTNTIKAKNIMIERRARKIFSSTTNSARTERAELAVDEKILRAPRASISDIDVVRVAQLPYNENSIKIYHC